MFPQRSRPALLMSAAWGGLKPAPGELTVAFRPHHPHFFVAFATAFSSAREPKSIGTPRANSILARRVMGMTSVDSDNIAHPQDTKKYPGTVWFWALEVFGGGVVALA